MGSTNKLGAWDTEVPDQYGLELSTLGRSGCLESKCASEGMAVGKKQVGILETRAVGVLAWATKETAWCRITAG